MKDSNQELIGQLSEIIAKQNEVIIQLKQGRILDNQGIDKIKAIQEEYKAEIIKRQEEGRMSYEHPDAPELKRDMKHSFEAKRRAEACNVDLPNNDNLWKPGMVSLDEQRECMDLHGSSESSDIKSDGMHWWFDNGENIKHAIYEDRSVFVDKLKAQRRKATPVTSGVLLYFPDAIKSVAKCSRIGNDQHHKGEPLHWDKSKSSDEYDAMVRHLLDHNTVGPLDDDGVLHLSKVAWRALAGLQRYLDGLSEEYEIHQKKPSLIFFL